MGTWGAGNFQDDKALDWLGGDVTRPLIAAVETNMRNVDSCNDHVITAAVEVLAVLCEQLNAVPPEPRPIIGWRDSYLRAWDGYIDALSGSDDYTRERREVIIATFNRLLKVAKDWHAIPLRIQFDVAMPETDRVRLQETLHAALTTENAGELTAGETFEKPAEDGTLTVITGRAFAGDTSISVLRRTIQAMNVRSATWISLNEPVDTAAEAW